jgi:ribosomal protein S18 acetylase RimI-like enzyme
LTDSRDNIVIIRNVLPKDIPEIVELQKESFPLMAKDGVIWQKHHLESHIKIFPDGQLCAELDGRIIASSSSLVISLTPEYKEHTWKEATAYGMFTNHTLEGDSLYGADISTHPDSRGLGIATMLYDARKDLAFKLNLRRIIAGGRLFNYCEYEDKMSAQEYAEKVVKGELKDLVLSFQLNNGFKLVKILPNYMRDARSLNYASFIEWINPKYLPERKSGWMINKNDKNN